MAHIRNFLFAFVAVLLSAQSASAALVFNIWDDDAGLAIQGVGSINTTGLSMLGSFGTTPGDVRVSDFDLLFYGGALDVFGTVTGTHSYGSAPYWSSFSGSADGFGLRSYGSQLVLPRGYVSGDALFAYAVTPGLALADTSLIAGTYQWLLPNDTVTLTIGSAPSVPLPAALPMLLGGLFLLFAIPRLRGLQLRQSA